MNELLMYLFKASVMSVLLYGVYILFFANTTFHALNRYYLLFIIPFSVICPVLETNTFFNSQIIPENLWINEFQEFPFKSTTSINGNIASAPISITNALLVIYLLGVSVLLVRFLVILYKLIRLKQSLNCVKKGKYIFIFTDKYNAPFSFFNWIFMPSAYLEIDGYSEIIKHEAEHSRQLHTLDLILSEIFCIAFWFNPFVFLHKKSLKTIHEYLADSKVVQNNSSINEYLKLLVNSAQVSCLSGITNHFTCLTIKKRIEMITKNKSSKYRKLVYLLIVPVVIIAIQAFSINKKVENPPKINPLQSGEVSLHYNYSGKNPVTGKDFTHKGLDIKAPLGTNVISAASGEVIKVSEEKGWGKLIVIQHDDVHQIWYAHLNDFSIKFGDKISAGQVIGHVGNTGYSTGSHLHYEVRVNGENVNPEDYMKNE